MKLSEMEKEIEKELISTIGLFCNDSTKLVSYQQQLKSLNILELAKKLKEEASSFIINSKNLQKQDENLNSTSYSDNSKTSKNNYEQMLIKLEQDIRLHIKTEFQLKIYCESLESKIDAIEKENATLNQLCSENKKKKDDEFLVTSCKITDLQDRLKKYENQVSDLKKQIKSFSTINNINISNNNTIHYLNNDIKSLSLNKKCKTKIADLSADGVVRQLTPPSDERKVNVEKKKENLRNYLNMKPDNKLNKKGMNTINNVNISGREKQSSSYIGGLSNPNIIDSLSTNLASVSTQLKLNKKDKEKNTSSSLNFNGNINMTNQNGFIGLNKNNIASNITSISNTQVITKPSSIIKNIVNNTNVKNNNASSVLGKNKPPNTSGVNGLTKNDNIALKTYMMKISERTSNSSNFNINSKNMKTLY